MNDPTSAGARLRAAVEQEHPLQVAGAINAYAARLAEAAGFHAVRPLPRSSAVGGPGRSGVARQVGGLTQLVGLTLLPGAIAFGNLIDVPSAA